MQAVIIVALAVMCETL